MLGSRLLSDDFHFAHGLLEAPGIEPNHTVISSFCFFISFNVNLGVLLIARHMSCKLPPKLAGSSKMNEVLSPSMMMMPNTSNHTVAQVLEHIYKLASGDPFCSDSAAGTDNMMDRKRKYKDQSDGVI